MYLNNYQHLINKETHILIFLFLFSFLVRVPIIFIFGDVGLENEWKILVNNLTDHGKLSLSWPRPNPIYLAYDEFFVPSVLMPPLYAFYLYFFKVLNFSSSIYILVVLFSQIILSSLSVIIFYKINKLFFSNKISIIGALIFSLFPLHVYACGQISSIILQSFLTVVFFYYFLKTTKKGNFINICFFSLTSGLLILLRGEFVALFILTILYMAIFLKTRIKNILIILILTIFVISPYLIRNMLVADTIVIAKSVGFNLWRGNNPDANVEGNLTDHFDETSYRLDINVLDADLSEQINKVPKDEYYVTEIDKVFFNAGLKNIKNDPKRYINLYIKKFFSFIFIDINSSYPNYYHPLHYLPALLISITSVVGIFRSNKNSYLINFFLLFFVAHVAIVSVFFILPRYKLAIIALQIIFSNILFSYIENIFLKKKLKNDQLN